MSAHSVFKLIPLVLLLAAHSAPAADSFFPSDDPEFRREMDGQLVKSREILKRIELDKPAPSYMPTPLALPVQTKGSPSPETIVRQYMKQPAIPSDDLIIFVTLSMPAETLKRLVDQSERTKAVLVLRGLKNGSLAETIKAVNKLIGDRKVSWQINPPAFSRFEVKVAPTFVLAAPTSAAMATQNGCADPVSYVAVAGDVSLDYALEYIQTNSPAFSSLAKKYLQLFGG